MLVHIYVEEDEEVEWIFFNGDPEVLKDEVMIPCLISGAMSLLYILTSRTLTHVSWL